MDRHTRGPVNKPSLRAGRQKKENKRQTQGDRERDYLQFNKFDVLWLWMRIMLEGSEPQMEKE